VHAHDRFEQLRDERLITPRMAYADDRREWLEPDGLGGFASGTVCDVRTRRYHALLLAAATPPTGRVVLVNGLETWIEIDAGRIALSTQRYAPDVTHPDGSRRIESFSHDPCPRWVFRLDDGTRIEQTVVAIHDEPLVIVTWKRLSGRGRLSLRTRPLLSGRDYHALHRENPTFRFDADVDNQSITWRPYASLPAIHAWANARYAHAPEWYRHFLYDEERARGLDAVEDLGSPGHFTWDVSRGEAVLALRAAVGDAIAPPTMTRERCDELREDELRRRHALGSPLDRAADAYIVRRGRGRTIIAGYPWFTDWGRDTFISLRGLCLTTGRLDDARAILLEWAEAVSDGMLPNRFPDVGQTPEYHAVDASLWYVIAADAWLSAMGRAGEVVATDERGRIERAIDAILHGYATGTRYGIRLDEDGLLRAGEPGSALTWMDAKVDGWAITPRVGKPVEVQALWLNALAITARREAWWQSVLRTGIDSFRRRFWNEAAGGLYDVVDVDHQPGFVDVACRPNQIFAVGGLPMALLDGERARRVVDLIELRLWTPMGLRSLAPGEPGYAPRCTGAPAERDAAYHRGTVWPWLAGPFVEAWVRVRGSTPQAKREARERFVAPLLRYLEEAGLGHVSEIADAEMPHQPRGCPFQAWSLAELLRLTRDVLDGPGPATLVPAELGEPLELSTWTDITTSQPRPHPIPPQPTDRWRRGDLLR